MPSRDRRGWTAEGSWQLLRHSLCSHVGADEPSPDLEDPTESVSVGVITHFSQVDLGRKLCRMAPFTCAILGCLPAESLLHHAALTCVDAS